jgi:hypothetical protein
MTLHCASTLHELKDNLLSGLVDKLFYCKNSQVDLLGTDALGRSTPCKFGTELPGGIMP